MRRLIIGAALVAWVGVFALLNTGAAGAATLPSNFQDTVVLNPGVSATAVRFASDGRVFVAQKDGWLKEFDSLHRHDADHRHRPRAARSTTTGTAACSVSRSTRTFRRPRTSTLLESYDAAIGQTAPQWNDDVPDTTRPDDGRLPDQRAPAEADPVGQHGDDHEGADQGPVVPAVPEPLDRRSQLRHRRSALRERRRRRQLHLRRLRAGRRRLRQPDAEEPVRRSARRGRRHDDARRRPRAALCGPRASGGRPAQPVLLNGAVLRVDPATGDALPDNPNAGEHRRERPADRRLRPPQPVPLHDQAAVERAVDRRRRLGQLGGDQPAAVSDIVGPELRLAVLRRQLAAAGLPERRPQPLLVALQRRNGDRPVLHLQPQRPRRRGRQLPAPEARRSTGIAFYTGASNYPGLYNGGLFFADYSRQLHLVHAGRLERAAQIRRCVQPFASGAVRPGRSRDRARTATSSTRI